MAALAALAVEVAEMMVEAVVGLDTGMVELVVHRYLSWFSFAKGSHLRVNFQ